MKIAKRSIFVMLLILLISVGLLWAETKKIVQDNLSKVVMIITFDQNNQPLTIGSGFYISTNGKIATNYHVLEGASSAIVKEIGADKKYEVESVIELNADHDVAIIKINKISNSVNLGRDETLLVGEKIVVIGNPEGLEGTVSEGIISGFRELSGDFRIIQITAPVSLGSSGGPLFNSKGEVVGVATASIVSGQNLNFAIPISVLHHLSSEKALNKKLSQVNFPIVGETKLNKPNSLETELIRIVDYEVSEGFIEFSIYNGSKYNIKDIKIIIIYYKGKWEGAGQGRHHVRVGEYPLHFKEEKFKDIIPSRLAKRFTRYFPGSYNWFPEFRVLDYKIVN
jgi:hypothetical protein